MGGDAEARVSSCCGRIDLGGVQALVSFAFLDTRVHALSFFGFLKAQSSAELL
jgi:hypothetical protein